MRRLAATAILLLALILSAGSVPAGAGEDPDDPCTDTVLNAFAVEACNASAAAEDEAALLGQALPAAAAVQGNGLPANCRFRVEVVNWTGADWMRLAEAFVADPSPCAEYYLSVPPPLSDRTRLRAASVYAEIRALGPNIHPMAEVNLGLPRGWREWVAAGNGTWCDAGKLFRTRMAAAGLRTAEGETWLLNELDRSTRLDVAPYTRAAMTELVRCLHDGQPGMPADPGAVEIGINFSHQNLPDVATYKQEMKGWLADGEFWTGLGQNARWILREAYPDTRYSNVPGTSRDERRRHLEDYIFNTLNLAHAGPAVTDAAKAVFDATYSPLLNGGYVALGGDAQGFVSGHGNTEIPFDQMMHFASEEVYAVRHYAGAHPQGAPAGRLGFSWQPFNRFGFPKQTFNSQLNAITARMASAVHYAYRQGGASPAGACRIPQIQEDWCNAAREGAVFTEVWETLKSWD
jgi:hypothetical protein